MFARPDRPHHPLNFTETPRSRSDRVIVPSVREPPCCRALSSFSLSPCSASGPRSGALSAEYPQRPITIVVPFSAGGPTDVLARVLGERMGRTLGQQLVVENVLGGGGSIGTTRVARAAPDGYTLVMGNLGTHAAAVGLYKKLLSTAHGLRANLLIGTTPMVLVKKKDFPASKLEANCWPGLKAESRARSPTAAPVSARSAISGNDLLRQPDQSHLRHVPYRGLSQAMNDLIAGQIDICRSGSDGDAAGSSPEP